MLILYMNLFAFELVIQKWHFVQMAFAIEPNTCLCAIPAELLIHSSILTQNPVKYNISWWIVPLKEMEMIFKNAKYIQNRHS